MEEVRGRPGSVVLPPGFGTPCGTPVTVVPADAADSCSYPCRPSRQSSAAGCALIDSVPGVTRGRKRTPPDLSPQGPRGLANHAAGDLAAMEAANDGDRQPNGAPVVLPPLLHPADVPLVGRQPTPEEITAARVRLLQKLAARNAAISKKAVSASSTVPEPDLDLLARVTAKFSVLLHRVGDALETAQRSHYFR